MAGIYDCIAVCFSGIGKKISKWWSLYFSWSWSALLVSGLYFGHAFVEYSFLGFLIILIQEKTGYSNLRYKAIISNAQDVVVGLLVIVLLCATSGCTRQFGMILITYGGFFLGSLILWVTPNLKIGMIYFALVPLTVGEAGEGFISHFLEMCINWEKEGQDDETIETRIYICRFIARFFGATIATLWISKLEWNLIFKSSAIITGTVYMLFCFGFKYYGCLNQSSPSEMPDSQRPWVIRIYQLFTERFFISNTESRRESICWPRDHNNRRELWVFLGKLPLWFPFLFYYVVEAAGSTFFMNQIDTLNSHIGKNFHVGQSSLLVVQKCSAFIASKPADYLIKKFCRDGSQERRVRLVRMYLGMLACSGCCIVAWHFETHRLDIFNKNPQSQPLPMSTLLLAPQFSLLGFADGLIEEGLEGFFQDYAPASMHRCAMAFSQAVDIGGKLIAIAFIRALKNWIGDDVNTSHLDSYYRMLAILVFCASQFVIILANIYPPGMQNNVSNSAAPPI